MTDEHAKSCSECGRPSPTEPSSGFGAQFNCTDLARQKFDLAAGGRAHLVAAILVDKSWAYFVTSTGLVLEYGAPYSRDLGTELSDWIMRVAEQAGWEAHRLVDARDKAADKMRWHRPEVEANA